MEQGIESEGQKKPKTEAVSLLEKRRICGNMIRNAHTETITTAHCSKLTIEQ